MRKFYYSAILFLDIYPREIWAIFIPKDLYKAINSTFLMADTENINKSKQNKLLQTGNNPSVH